VAFIGSAIVGAGLTVGALLSTIDIPEHTNAPCEGVVEITDNTIHIQKPLPVGCTLAPY
jgi:hypothetical protein